MIWKKALLSMIVFLVLAGIYVGDRWWVEQKRTAKEMSERAFPIKREDVIEATVVIPAEIITVRKESGDRWMMTQPLKTSADKDAIEVLLGNLLPALRYGEFTMDETIKLEDYGLDAPTHKLKVITKDVPQGMTLLIGKQAPESGKFFAKIDSENKIFSINEYIKNNLDKKPFDLRDRTVLAVAVEDVQRIVLKQNVRLPIEIKSVEGETTKTTTGSFTKPVDIVLAKTGTEWRLEQPLTGKADLAEVENFLRKLKTEKVVTFIDDPPSTATFGFDKPQIDLQVEETATTGTTQPRTLTLLVGDRASSPTKGYYAKREDGSVVAIPDSLFEDLTLKVSKLRDKQLFHLTSADVASLEIETLKSRTKVVKNEQGRWVFADDPATSVSQQAVSNAVSSLVNLRAKDFETDEPTSLALYRLDRPVRLTVADKDGKTTEALEIGDLATRDGESVLFARLRGSKTIILLDFMKPSEFALTKEDLVDKTLFTFDTQTVAHIEVRQPATSFTLVREGETWKLHSPKSKEPRRVDTFLVGDLTRAIRDLEYKDIFRGNLTDAEMGFTSPSLQVALYDTSKTVIAEIIRGKDRGERYYTRVKEGGQVYGIEKSEFENLDAAVSNLLKEE